MTAPEIHRGAARLFVPAALAVAITSAGLALVRRRAARLVMSIGAFLAAIVASATGFLLPWDQLALYQVTVGTSISGYTDILFSNDVKYVLIGNTEIGASTLARWFWIHTVGLPILLVVLLVGIASYARSVKSRGVLQKRVEDLADAVDDREVTAAVPE